MSDKCDFCNKESTHYYDKHNLCELHYLRQNPQRNAPIVLLEIRGIPPWKIKDRIQLIEELKNHLSLEEIDECLKHESWYEKLKQEVEARKR